MAYIGFKKLAAQKGPALAAFIGRKKYGAKNMAHAAAKGEKMNKPNYQAAAKRRLARG